MRRSKILFYFSVICLFVSLTVTAVLCQSFASFSMSGTIEYISLPSGYTQLEYIESTGTQYINTGVKTARTLKFECKFLTTVQNTLLFGARESTTANGVTFGYFSSKPSSFVGYGASTSSYNTTINCLNGIQHVVYLSNNEYTIDGQNQTISNRGTLNKFYDIYLGTWNTDGVADTRRFVGKIYSFKIWNNENLVLNLIPCKNASNVVGMYDIVNNQFYQNAGTGTFIAGTVV